MLILLLGGCTTIAPERKSYPSSWPALAPTPQRDCEPPTGVFENRHWLEHYEYPETSGYRAPAPRLSSVLEVGAIAAPVTHLFAQGKLLYANRLYPQALTCFNTAADHPDGGNREAMWHLCLMYELGLGVEKNLEVAQDWCRRAESRPGR